MTITKYNHISYFIQDVQCFTKWNVSIFKDFYLKIHLLIIAIENYRF